MRDRRKEEIHLLNESRLPRQGVVFLLKRNTSRVEQELFALPR